MNNKFYITRKNKLIDSIKDNIYCDNIYLKIYINDIVKKYSSFDKEILNNKNIIIAVSGRIILKRVIGKVIFINIQDIFNNIQIYFSYKFLLNFNFNKYLDIGDIVYIKGKLFKTKTLELSINCQKILLLSKSLRQLPDKFKGLLNSENKIKNRYLDLISNIKTRKTFLLRSKIILEIRKYLNKLNFIEVETPIMQKITGGANAKPFCTKYNYTKNDLYLRISPELYLKRLIVSGFNKIFEIGKNFRNEGISNIHNPEFTMLEIYHVFINYKKMINIVEKFFKYLYKKIFKNYNLLYKNIVIDLNKKFLVLTMLESIYKYNNISKKINLNKYEECYNYFNKKIILKNKKYSLSELQFEIFKNTVEKKIINPTFITNYPTEISPLAKKNNKNPFYADRFELFFYGMEIANGFSELNNSEEQSERFIKQIKNNNIFNKNINMFYDKDYINSLEYGLPPTSGVGIGIDRLIMIFTNNFNIKDVILFPNIRYK